MKFKFFTAALALAGLPCFAQEQHKDNYEKSVFAQYRLLSPSLRSNTPGTLQKVQQHFPGMMVSLDKLTQNFHDIFGGSRPVAGSTLSAKVHSLFAQDLTAFGLNESEWIQTAEVHAPKAAFVSYKQQISGHEVVFSSLKFRFTHGGDLQRITLRSYGAPSLLAAAPAISASAAKTAAEQDLQGVQISESTIGNDWYWFPVPTTTGYNLRPAYVFNIKGAGENLPVDLTGYVDGITGEVLYRTNKVKETIVHTVKGVVYKQNPLTPVSTEPLSDLKLIINGVSYYTDTAGMVNIPGLSVPVADTGRLEGRWSTVRTGNVVISKATPNLITTSGATYIFDTTLPVRDRHVNAYYHVTRVHDFMKNFYPSFTNMDFSLPTNVDLTTGTCNAFYNGTSINFYAAGGGCNSFAYCGDIIYHEYGHGISDKFYGYLGQGTLNNGALNEANSDIWGISITKDPVLGKGASGGGGIIRRYDLAPKVYPADIIGEVHADGEIVAGAWWDVAVNINSVDTMTQLFTDVYYDTPDGPGGTEGAVYHDVLISALINDDNDASLSNGTPHFTQIVNAFARHGIFLLGDAAIAHTELAHQPKNTTITVSADLTLSTPAFFQDMLLYYRARGGQWDSTVMTQTTGNTYTAQIPAQAPGTLMDYYFGVFDNQSTLSAVAPDGYFPSIAQGQITIPFQFGIGIDARSTVDFETPLPSGWTVGNGPGDGATSGIWVQAKPIGSFVSGIVSNTPVQPNADHTTGALGKCLVTGNASSTTAQPGVADVDGGATTVITQHFDVSGFDKPIIEYWRWYSNNAGSNPGTDYWTVFVRDSAVSGWSKRVDYTKKTDAHWRRRIFALNEYMSPAQKVQLKFIANDALPNSIVEAAVDDIVIYDSVKVTSVQDRKALKAEIFPNPAGNAVQVKFSRPISGYLSLHDLSGKQVLSMELKEKTLVTVDLQTVPSGAYFLTVSTDGFIQSKKLVVSH